MEYVILIVSLVGIVLGADWLVAGAVSIAKKYKVSDFVIGAAIVGVGTSMPELVVSFIGAVQGNADVAIGNIVGSNIFNVLGILGITALFFPIAISKDNMKFEIARELGVNLRQGYNGDLSARENGYVGGYMVKRLIEQAEKQMTRQ